MIKRFLVSIFLLFSVISFAQQGTSSPYSLFGVGDVRFRGSNEIISMGGVSVFPDSIHLNVQNPASYSHLKLTTFTLGGSLNAVKFKTNESSESANRSRMDYLGFGVPIGKKFGASFGLNPFSSSGYKIRTIDTENAIIRQYQANGGLNQVYLGLGYNVLKNLSVGANVNYNFGRLETDNILYIADAQFATQELNESQLSGVTFNLGVMYNTKINEKVNLYSAFSYIPKSDLNSDEARRLLSIIYVGEGVPTVVDSLNFSYTDRKIKLPSKTTFSLGIGENKKWLLGGEVALTGSNEFSSSLTNATNASYEDAIRYSVGGYYIPKYNSFNSYFERITYRGGFRYENTGLVIKNTAINDYAITAGAGLPINGSFSNVNVGLELGRRGTTTGNLIQENYFNLMISMSFSDLWFVQRKYD